MSELQKLLHKGFHYAAAMPDGRVFAFSDKPVWKENQWMSFHSSIQKIDNISLSYQASPALLTTLAQEQAQAVRPMQ